MQLSFVFIIRKEIWSYRMHYTDKTVGWWYQTQSKGSWFQEVLIIIYLLILYILTSNKLHREDYSIFSSTGETRRAIVITLCLYVHPSRTLLKRNCLDHHQWNQDMNSSRLFFQFLTFSPKGIILVVEPSVL